ncbi:MAG: hypothetical protein ACLGHN_08105 [Bacteriovoracia bacterium]
MKTVNLTLGRSTILSFAEKPIKVVAGNSNYFNIEYIGNDLTIQPLANVETNLFVYTEPKGKYGFHLKVGHVSNYDDVVYIKWKNPYATGAGANAFSALPRQKRIKEVTLKTGTVEITIHQFIRLKGTRSYFIEFEARNKGTEEIKLSSLDVFASRESKRLKGQKLVFDQDTLKIHGQSKGRLFLSIPEDKDFSFYVHHQGKLKRTIISNTYL